jgi:hypothetical protein
MRRPLALTYVIVTIVFFLGVIGVAGYRAQNIRNEARITAAESFSSYYNAVATRLREQGGVDSSVAQQELKPRQQADAGLRSVVLYSLRDGVYYLWAADRNRITFGAAAADVPVPDIQTNQVTEVRFLESLQVDDGTLILEAIYRLLAPRDGFILLRDTLIAVLSFAVITLLVAIVSVLVSQRRAGMIKTTPEVDIPLEPGGRTEPAAERDGTPVPEPESVPESAAEPSDAAMPEPSPEESIAAPEDDTPPATEPPAHEAGSVPKPSAGPSAPAGAASSLFSESSGVGHREHLEHRLSLELERAAYNEQDLASALAAFPGIEPETPGYRQAAELLVERFGFRDLIFEFDDETFCIILPNADLDEAIHLVEDFQRTAAGRLPQDAGEPIFGLSARNGRLVDGARLIREAQRALDRAAGAAGRIIGFRPDPQKYRRHIADTESGASH